MQVHPASVNSALNGEEWHSPYAALPIVSRVIVSTEEWHSPPTWFALSPPLSPQVRGLPRLLLHHAALRARLLACAAPRTAHLLRGRGAHRGAYYGHTYYGYAYYGYAYYGYAYYGYAFCGGEVRIASRLTPRRV